MLDAAALETRGAFVAHQGVRMLVVDATNLPEQWEVSARVSADRVTAFEIPAQLRRTWTLQRGPQLQVLAISTTEGNTELGFTSINPAAPIELTADIQNGDVFVTSGIDGTYPPGLVVAQVTERLIQAMRHPHVDIVAHPSGRLMPEREGADLVHVRRQRRRGQAGLRLSDRTLDRRSDTGRNQLLHKSKIHRAAAQNSRIGNFCSAEFCGAD